MRKFSIAAVLVAMLLLPSCGKYSSSHVTTKCVESHQEQHMSTIMEAGALPMGNGLYIVTTTVCDKWQTITKKVGTKKKVTSTSTPVKKRTS